MAIAGMVRPISKPDLSNYIKGIEDALDGLVLRNDSQIVQYGQMGKWYGEMPRVEVLVLGLDA